MLFKSQIWTIFWLLSSFQVNGQQFYTNVGDQFITFEQADIDGNLISDKSLIGKPSIVVFFGTRCPPCLQKLKMLDEGLPSSWQSRLNIYAIGSTDDAMSLTSFQYRTGYAFAFIPDPNQYLFNQIGDYVIPRMFLLDKEGKILKQSVGFDHTIFDDLLTTLSSLI
jgi:peroxiredoxin